ncbi:MAG: rhodanese-like domain-containing protein [Actinomycetota bacterium]|nr:rhodanese-like domain-containing protein [Actinomycetota bacterium]
MLDEARSSLRRLHPEEALAAMKQGALLIDVRCESDRTSTGGIRGALNIPLTVLEWRLDSASETRHPDIAGTDRRVILICAQGYSSSLAARRLHELGFHDATDVIGGFEAWAEHGLPVERPG